MAGELLNDLDFSIIDEIINHLVCYLVDHWNEILQLLAYKLSRHNIAQPAMLAAVAVFKNIGAKDMPGSKIIGSIWFVHGPVVALVVLKGAIYIPVSGNNPSVVKAVVINRVVIAKLLVDRKWVFLELWRIEYSGIDFCARRFFCFRHTTFQFSFLRM